MKPGGTAATSEVGDCCARSGHSLRYGHSYLTTCSLPSTLQANLAMGVTLIQYFSQDGKDNLTLPGLQFGQVLAEKLVACIHLTDVNDFFLFLFSVFYTISITS